MIGWLLASRGKGRLWRIPNIHQMICLVPRQEVLDVYNQWCLGEDMHAVGIGTSIATKRRPIVETKYVVVQIERGIFVDIVLVIIRSVVGLIGREKLAEERRDNEEV